MRLSSCRGKECEMHAKMHLIPIPKTSDKKKTWRVSSHLESVKASHPSGFEAGPRLSLLNCRATQIHFPLAYQKQEETSPPIVVAQIALRVALVIKTLNIEDDPNETLDPQHETLFEDDPYAEEQTDEEEYESDLEIEERRIGQGHRTAKPKTTSRSKLSRKPPSPDNFARLHLGSTSIPFCLPDTSAQRRSLWASSLYTCLKSYQNQCRNTDQQSVHGASRHASEPTTTHMRGRTCLPDRPR